MENTKSKRKTESAAQFISGNSHYNHWHDRSRIHANIFARCGGLMNDSGLLFAPCGVLERVIELRKKNRSDEWHVCINCSQWPESDYKSAEELPKGAKYCLECLGKEKGMGGCDYAQPPAKGQDSDEKSPTNS